MQFSGGPNSPLILILYAHDHSNCSKTSITPVAKTESIYQRQSSNYSASQNRNSLSIFNRLPSET